MILACKNLKINRSCQMNLLKLRKLRKPHSCSKWFVRNTMSIMQKRHWQNVLSGSTKKLQICIASKPSRCRILFIIWILILGGLMQLSEIMVKASQAPHHLLLPQCNKQVVSSKLCQIYSWNLIFEQALTNLLLAGICFQLN